MLIFYNDGSTKIFKNLSLKKYEEGQAVVVRINTNRTKKLKDDKIIRIQKAYGGFTKIGPTTDKGKRGCLPDDLYFSEVKYET